MLTSTYIHASGIGAATEKQIWEAGASDWHQFLQMHTGLGLPERKMSLLLPVIEESVERLRAEDYAYFAEHLAGREHWRCFGELANRAAFLDIETTGMSSGSAITVIGVFDGITTKSFIKGFNFDDFPSEMEKYPLVVTYAGGTFDLPHLRHAFPGALRRQLHIDLCPTLRRIGYKGGLKHIENQFGLTRSDSIRGLDGWDAVRLWNEWEDGSREALDILVEYNRADVENLKPLAEFAYTKLREAHLPSVR